jgi:hypothetical protein
MPQPLLAAGNRRRRREQDATNTNFGGFDVFVKSVWYGGLLRGRRAVEDVERDEKSEKSRGEVKDDLRFDDLRQQLRR